MKKIYLASGSKARKKLLDEFKIPCKVIPSRIKERHDLKGMPFAGLVKHNALAKARAAAEKVKDGLIIGADTITVQDGRVFGKPKNMLDARRMLKRLSRKPQWLYTGVALIDKESGRTLVDYEKTKVIMDRLSDKEIRQYFRRVTPMDKAGGFDIQGEGAFFIRRIEGCFYNVVGLPMRKLFVMCRKLGITLAVVLVVGCQLLSLSGCSTEYNMVTGEQETFYYSTDKEVQMGKAIMQEAERGDLKLVDDPLMQKRVEDIGKKIAAVCDRKEIDYTFKVLDDDEINAVSLPGGVVYVNKGLVERVDNDDQLAGVLAHEVGHIVARHSIKKLQAMQGYSLFRILTAVAPGTGEVGAAADAAFTELLLGYNREDELLADQLGTRYAKLAGYNPHEMVIFLAKLEESNRRKPLRPKSYFKTHPYVPDRIRVVKQELGESINFKDYINIEQKTHD